ncbi:glucose dehydrogenase [FAD quinone] [Biomphalaria pfeifferi]|uniref:Glucose dehydrogenase [FAD quinone] n=1 Tax=Biomphalaria pfeifferi TaxID=112525 RepID=A0AAD8AQZ6_BIOPF|nr:glucose dehydrogenase [FAD quinone] [Biomphalaria pfeifferi]
MQKSFGEAIFWHINYRSYPLEIAVAWMLFNSNNLILLLSKLVGGGTAGCLLAGRLSEDPDVTVLLLEAGPDDTRNTLIDIPLLAGLIWRTPLDWEYYSETSSDTMKQLRNGVSLSIGSIV